MRRALATATVAGVLALVPATATVAFADSGTAVVAQTGTDRDEPALEDGNDDTGKYGLIGLTGLLGLFGYKKYRDHRDARVGSTGTTGASGTDGSSRRV